MKNITQKIILATLFITLIYSCTPTKTLSLKTSPSDAEILVKNLKVGNSPVEVKVEFPGKEGVPFSIVKDGYENFIDTLEFEPKEKTSYLFELTKKEAIEVDVVIWNPLQTNRGIKLQSKKIITLAYIETIERSPAVKSATRVTNFKDPLQQVGEVYVSPKGDAIVYSIYEYEKEMPLDGYSNILTQMPIGSASQTKLSTGTKLDLLPSYSPEGDYIYFSSNRITYNPTIWKVRGGGGGGLTSITNNNSEDIAPYSFSDGESIVYTSLLDGTDEPQIWTVNKSGMLPTQLREGEYGHPDPVTDNIVFVRADRNFVASRILLGGDTLVYNPMQIWTMTREGGSETQMTQNSTHNCIQPKWSPDGNWIVYASDEGKDSKGRNNYDIWMMKKDGTNKTQLTTNGSWDDNPCWSPDGKKIYFRSNRGGVWNIWYFEPIMN